MLFKRNLRFSSHVSSGYTRLINNFSLKLVELSSVPGTYGPSHRVDLSCGYFMLAPKVDSPIIGVRFGTLGVEPIRRLWCYQLRFLSPLDIPPIPFHWMPFKSHLWILDELSLRHRKNGLIFNSMYFKRTIKRAWWFLHGSIGLSFCSWLAGRGGGGCGWARCVIPPNRN